MRLVRLILPLLALAVQAPAAQAMMRCGHQLVAQGDSEYSLLRKCGTPTYVSGSYWFYDPGEGRFLRIVHVFAGEVTDIELGERSHEERPGPPPSVLPPPPEVLPTPPQPSYRPEGPLIQVSAPGAF